jgi:hypothetical protein
VFWEGHIRHGHIIGRYCISGAMSELMGVDREAAMQSIVADAGGGICC